LFLQCFWTNRFLQMQSSEDVLIDNQAAEEGYQNFEVISHPSKRLRVSVKRETGAHSEEESVAPVVGIERGAREEGSSSFSLQGSFLKPYFTGKRRERKPMKQVMRRRSSGSTTAPHSSHGAARGSQKKSSRMMGPPPISSPPFSFWTFGLLGR
jgi:hypothetical protein